MTIKKKKKKGLQEHKTFKKQKPKQIAVMRQGRGRDHED